MVSLEHKRQFKLKHYDKKVPPISRIKMIMKVYLIFHVRWHRQGICSYLIFAQSLLGIPFWQTIWESWVLQIPSSMAASLQWDHLNNPTLFRYTEPLKAKHHTLDLTPFRMGFFGAAHWWREGGYQLVIHWWNLAHLYNT